MRSKLIGFTLFLVWAIMVLGAYYVFHKPFDIPNFEALLGSAGSLLAALAIATACAGVGRAVLKRALISRDDDLSSLALAYGVGFGLLGLLWLGLALAGLLKIWIAWLVLGGLLVVTYRQWRSWWSGLLKLVRSWTPVNSSHRLIAIAILLLSAMSLINALGPPHAWDALMYHLTSPLHHLRAGHLVVEPSLPESGYPQLVEMHYAWLLLLGAPRATAVLHGLFGILTSLLIFSLMRRWINDQAAWLTLAILYSAGTWTRLMGIAYIDLVLVFYATLAFTQLLGWMDKDDRGSTILLGVLAGFCFGVKYTGVFVGVALLILMVWRRPRKLGRIMVYFGPAAFVVALPWLLKNLQTGSLFYPFLGNGMGWDPIRRAWFSRVGTGLLHSNPIHIVTAPIMMTILGADGAQTWDANFGPLMLLLVPLLLIGWRAYRQDIWFRYGLGWAVLLYAGWLLGAAVSSLLVIPRLLFPLVPVLAMVLGASVQRLFTVELKGLSLGRITLALILVVLLLTTVSQVGNFLEDQSLEVALGWTDSEDYLYQQLGWYHGAIRSLDALPDSSQVLFLFEPRSYYCPPGRCIPDGILDRWYWYRQRGLGIQDIVNEWCGQGVTHVLLYKLGIDLLRTGDDPLSQDDWAALDQLIQAHLVEVENFGDAYILYRLSSSNPGEP